MVSKLLLQALSSDRVLSHVVDQLLPFTHHAHEWPYSGTQRPPQQQLLPLRVFGWPRDATESAVCQLRAGHAAAANGQSSENDSEPLLCTTDFATVISVVRFQPSVGPGSSFFPIPSDATAQDESVRHHQRQERVQPLVLWSALPRTDWDPRAWRAWVNQLPSSSQSCSSSTSTLVGTSDTGSTQGVATVAVDTAAAMHAREVRQRVVAPRLRRRNVPFVVLGNCVCVSITPAANEH